MKQKSELYTDETLIFKQALGLLLLGTEGPGW